MAILYKNFRRNVVNAGPLLLLYYISISEIDTQFSNLFEILSFNLQIIIIYYWTLKSSSVLGNGHIFLVGIINDVVMGLPLGLSSITYLVVSFVASYVKNVTVSFPSDIHVKRYLKTCGRYWPYNFSNHLVIGCCKPVTIVNIAEAVI